MLAGVTTPAPLSPAIISSTQTHLSNLQRLLPKPPPQPPPPPSPPPTTTKKPKFNLSLSSFLRPPLTADDNTISPRTLTHLHHLLSSPPLPSPKNNISSQWHLYHGSGDWSNLIDPLDENLRRELIRYGELIQSAYQSFHSSSSSSSMISLPSHHSYHPTTTLFATSSIPLPPFLTTTRSNPIGYIAVCDDAAEIRRMGRRDIVIVLRGTSTLLEWAENFRANLVPLDSDHQPKVECGFRSLYKTAGDAVPSLSSSVVAEVQRLLQLYSGENLSITVTGHSLGAALAVLVADELSLTCSVPIAVFSFGGPRVGNRAFAERVRRRGVRVLRVVNAGDVVTKVPGVLPREEEVWHVLHEWLDGYAHVGRELRVDSRVSPYLRPNPDPACCHDLEAYLHLVDGYLGSDSPFRSNAKRSLVKLFTQQGSNVKKPFVSKARALGF